MAALAGGGPAEPYGRNMAGSGVREQMFDPAEKDKPPVTRGFIWSGRPDSNWRPSPWQGDALPLSHARNGSHYRWGIPRGRRPRPSQTPGSSPVSPGSRKASRSARSWGSSSSQSSSASSAASSEGSPIVAKASRRSFSSGRSPPPWGPQVKGRTSRPEPRYLRGAKHPARPWMSQRGN